MKVRSLAWSAALLLVLASFAACDVTNDSDADSTGGGGTVDTPVGTPDTGGTPTDECGADEYCNYDPAGATCSDTSGRPTDPDCNPAIKALGDKSNGKWDPNCSCNFWGGICEAISKCSPAVCLCDTDCTPTDGSLEAACTNDNHCDTYCPKNADPNCSGGDNGKYCSAPSCNQKSGVCESGCSSDPDCGTFEPCEGDGFCDSKCAAGADPDC
jgi:hypothetical protein